MAIKHDGNDHFSPSVVVAFRLTLTSETSVQETTGTLRWRWFVAVDYKVVLR